MIELPLEGQEEEPDLVALSDALCEWSLSYTPRSLMLCRKSWMLMCRNPSQPCVECKCLHSVLSGKLFWFV